MTYVQFGCGLSCPPSWVNFDASPTLRLQRLPMLGPVFARLNPPVFPAEAQYGDIIRGFPIQTNSCQGFYSSHVLEHLALEDLRKALGNVYSYLQPGRTFRMVLPDLEILVGKYLATQDPTAAEEFMRESLLGRPRRDRRPAALIRNWIGNSTHLWMWDFKGLKQELESVGFQSVRRAQIGDSSDGRFLEVEEASRWNGCLGIECVK